MLFQLLFILTLLILIILHELGHFLLAKKFKVKVEEFGIGYPPRIWAKKIGETILSINLLPLGGFVKIFGEEEKKEDPRSFSQKPIWQRALIILGGCFSFWIICFLLLSLAINLGVPRAIGDEVNGNLTSQVNVQIVAIAPESPAEKAGLQVGDIIKEFQTSNDKFQIDKVKQVQELTQANKGKEVTLIIERGKEVLEIKLMPRVSPPQGEGPIGVGLLRVVVESYPWYQAFYKGVVATGNLTIFIIQGWIDALVNLIKGLPTGLELMGPIRTTELSAQIGQLGIGYFVQFIAVLSLYVGLFNLLPIPALDGGKLLFLGIEKIRGKPISQKVEQKITAFFFALLIAMMIWVTIKDITKVFF